MNDEIFQYVGALSGTLICFIYPALFAKYILGTSKQIIWGLEKRTAAFLLFVIGVFVFIISLAYPFVFE